MSHSLQFLTQHKLEKKTMATGAIVLATAFWGITFPLIKAAVSTLNPFYFLLLRFGLAALMLILIYPQKVITINRAIATKGCLLGFFLAATVTFQTIGLQYTRASNASFITGLSVIFVTFFSSLIKRQLPSLKIVMSAIMAVSGLALITLDKSLSLNVGDIWVFCCAIAFALYIIIAGNFSDENHSIALTMVQMIAITIVTGVGCLVNNSNYTIPSSIKVWVALTFCSLFASIFAFCLQLHFQRFLSATKTSIIFSTEPIFATITAYFYSSEHISGRFFCGATFILSAMLLSELNVNVIKSCIFSKLKKTSKAMFSFIHRNNHV